MNLLKVFVIVSLTTCVASCGATTGTVGSPTVPAAGGAINPNYTMVFNSSAELPACGASNAKQLVYVTSESIFKTCDSGSWNTITITSGASSGLSITSNQLLNAYSTNICTAFSSIEECYFNGGQLVKFSDGTVLVTGIYSYDSFTSAAANGGSSDSDRLSGAITVIVPSTVSAAYQRLDWAVSRGSTYFESLFLVYDRTSDQATIVFDANGNGAPEAGDQVVHTVVKSNW